MRRMGIELRDVLVFDTLLAEWVIAGNRNASNGWGLGLDETSIRYKLGNKLSLSGLMIKGGCPTEMIPRMWLQPYCFQDVELCYQLYLKQREVLHESGLMHIALTRNLCCACLADIEFNGCHLDKKMVVEEYEAAINAFHDAEEQLESLAEGINLSSSKQLAVLLYDRLGFDPPKDHRGNVIVTGKGALSTNANTLTLLIPKTDEQKKFLELYKIRNKLDALISKNLEFFKRVVEEYGGVFYGNLQQGFTQTHRLSASGRPLLFKLLKKAKGAQFQNLPRVYKKLFTSHNPDEVVLEADGAQLEFRVAAEVGHDAVAIKDIVDGADIHSYTAEVLTKAGEPTTRQGAKSSTFSPLYGGGGKTKAQKAYSIAFKQKYHGIAEVQTGWTHEVLNTGKLVLPWGMTFYWPNTKMGRSGYIDNTTSIFNYPIQSFATAEIIPIALVYFWHRSKHLRLAIFNTVHDSIASRVNREDVQEAMELSKVCLTTDVYNHLREVYNYEFSVPLGVGSKWGRNWGASKQEHVWSVWPSGDETYVLKE